jgi:hypothetical protein
MKTLNFILFLAAILYLSCDAPRLNPFDPKAENHENKYLTIVNVRRIYPPNEPIPEVLVEIQNLRLFGKTDLNGEIRWRHDYIDSLIINSNRTGFFPDTVTFPVLKEINNIELLLNAKPQTDSIKIYSIRDNAGDITYVSVDATISDPDGFPEQNIVYINAPAEMFKDTLQFNPVSREFNTRFNVNGISVNFNIQELPEIDFYLIIKKNSKDSLSTSVLSVRRVILAELKLLQPNITQPAIGTLEFSWEKVSLAYSFSQFIILFKLNGNVQRIGRFGPISSEKSSFILDDPEILDIQKCLI